MSNFISKSNFSLHIWPNVYKFHGVLKDRIVALIAVERAGRHKSATSERTETNIEHLIEIDSLTREIREIKAKLKKTKQMVQQIKIIAEIKTRKAAIMNLASLLR